MMENPLLTKVFEVEVVTDLEKIEAHFISEDWVGIDCYSDILIDNNIQKTDQSSKKLTSGQTTKQPSYIQMFLDMYMKIKKKPSEGDQPIKGKKLRKRKTVKKRKEKKYDVIGLTETWLHPEIPDRALDIEGYRFIRSDRLVRRGGGTGVYIKNNLVYKVILKGTFDYLEQLWIEIKLEKNKYALGIVYRPPNSDSGAFLNQFEDT
ncbi:hypothetical protein JTB14_013331 [Gonioctena quinquepunctata]|nr:hypothetical protein JTB14_013331 [Gonioctena quinquepunctata]